jgi:pimeloyl-ACP methyl ester carboxylesterase
VLTTSQPSDRARNAIRPLEPSAQRRCDLDRDAPPATGKLFHPPPEPRCWPAVRIGCATGHARGIAAALPHADFVIYPRAGRLPLQERAQEVAERIAALVRRVETTREGVST